MQRIRRYLSLPAITGMLFVCAGARDIFAPGFLSISPRAPSADEAAVYITIGLMFLGVAMARKRKVPAPA